MDSSSVFETEFNIDSNLLSDNSLTDSTLKFNLSLPIEWIPIDNSFQNLLDKINVSGVKYGYLSPRDSSNVIILKVQKGDQVNYEELRSNYMDLLKDSIWQDVKYNQFTYRCHFVEQYVLQNSQILSFRLIVYEGKYQMDSLPKFELVYNVNRQNYERNIKMVESSIGTLDCLTQ